MYPDMARNCLRDGYFVAEVSDSCAPTLGQTNKEPEKGSFIDRCPLNRAPFSGSMLVGGSVYTYLIHVLDPVGKHRRPSFLQGPAPIPPDSGP